MGHVLQKHSSRYRSESLTVSNFWHPSSLGLNILEGVLPHPPKPLNYNPQPTIIQEQMFKFRLVTVKMVTDVRSRK
jgi:hypothetical protein